MARTRQDVRRGPGWVDRFMGVSVLMVGANILASHYFPWTWNQHVSLAFLAPLGISSLGAMLFFGWSQSPVLPRSPQRWRGR